MMGETTPPPRIGKIGPYTVFMTPPATPNHNPVLNSPNKTTPVPVQDRIPVGTPQVQSRPPVQAPPPQFDKEKSSSLEFLWDAVVKVQNAHKSLDEHVAHWFGLNQSKYQWALDDYYETNGNVQKHKVNPVKYRMCNILVEQIRGQVQKLDSGSPYHINNPM